MTDINPRDLIRRLADDLEGITEELVIPEYAHTEKERTDASLALIAEARDYLCQAESHAPIGAANRIAHYLEQRQLIRGLDQDVIHAMHGLYTGLAQAAQQEEVEGGVLTDPRMIQCFVIGFFANPILWIAIHHLINRK